MSDYPPAESRYDVHFRCLGFPVCVHPAFWLIHIAFAAILASDDDILRKSGLHPLVVALLTFACTAVSVFLHELGHALVGRRYGSDVEIGLDFFGGFAGLDEEDASRRQRVVTILAGPLVTLALAVVGGVGFFALQPPREEVERILDEQYAAAPDNPDVVPGVPPPPPGWAALGHVFLGLFAVNSGVLLLNLIPFSGTDGQLLLDEFRGWRRNEPDCERGPDGWKRDAG